VLVCAGEIDSNVIGAEGATAPETLRQQGPHRHKKGTLESRPFGLTEGVSFESEISQVP